MHELRQDPDLDFIWRWFEFQKELSSEKRASVLRSSFVGTNSVQRSQAQQSRFVGLTPEEVRKFFDEQTDQLESITMLELLSTTEAILRMDFKARVATRTKDELSRRCRDIQKDRDDKVRLDEDILEAMKEEGIPVAEFRGTLRLRHWLAHGRHWQPKLGRVYTPEVVFDVTKQLIGSIAFSK